ncbi:hypothetical protein I4U23_007817 [Adineta vaga]|nr:hypothetical protein I4U23_007817 [Adineta vaga]
MSSYRVLTEKPDADAIEMFCGQIPRTMSENELRIFFEQYGRIYKLNILRDKQNGESKGCCFITYYTRKDAIHAQNLLHNLMILPGMHYPIQIKPADIENRNERKIFIGMISKSCHEEDIKQLFKLFGSIEECTVLRDTNNRSRGCAFVTYQKRQSALNAIRTMHHSCTMDGCLSPINVRFADTTKDKEARKMQPKFDENLFQNITTNSLPETNDNLSSFNVLLFNQLCSNAIPHVNDLSCGDNNTNHSFPLSNILKVKSNYNEQNKILSSFAPLTTEWKSVDGIEETPLRSFDNSVNKATGEGNEVTINTSLLCADDQSTKQQHMTNVKDDLSTSTNFFPNSDIHTHTYPSATDDDLRLLDSFLSLTTKEIVHLSNLSSVDDINFQSSNNLNNNNSQLIIHSNDEKQIIGPVGSNLFIYHLPSEFTDHDLAEIFSPFGNILSAKVFIDKITNRSKCFGFISYDNIYSAHQAIKQMNGFHIGFKRLKVQLKKPRLQ